MKYKKTILKKKKRYIHFSFNCLKKHLLFEHHVDIHKDKEKMQPLNSLSSLIIPLLTCKSQSTTKWAHSSHKA